MEELPQHELPQEWSEEEEDTPDMTPAKVAKPVLLRTSPPSSAETVEVTFSIQFTTQPGEAIAVAGETLEFGDWDSLQAFPLKWTPGHVWTGTIKLPYPFEAVEYKYIWIKPNETVWEMGTNRRLTPKFAYEQEGVRVIDREEAWGQPT